MKILKALWEFCRYEYYEFDELGNKMRGLSVNQI